MLRNGDTLETKLDLIAARARQDPSCKFTSLAYLLDEEFLAACYGALKKKKAPGVDGVTVEEYGKNLEKNLQDLVRRMKAKRYYPQPVRRVYIPKRDGSKLRPLGIPAVEDKIVQMGMAKILEAIFEGDFLSVSYGFRPHQGCHNALQAFDEVMFTRPVSFVIEVDIKGYFDHIDHKWLMECLRQRISDPSFLSLIWRTLKAGVLEEGQWRETEAGSPQGGIVSPILSNVFLHYVLDLWFEKKLKKTMKGYAKLIRYADDFIICRQYRWQAKVILEELKRRLTKFGLSTAEEKTHIRSFGRFAYDNARKEGHKADTVEFLGFTHFCAKTSGGKFRLGRRTNGKRFRGHLKAMNLWLKQVRNEMPLPEWWGLLRQKMTGYYQYYAVSRNGPSVKRYYAWVLMMTYKPWNYRSQKRSGTWPDFWRRLRLFPLPLPRIVHSWAPSIARGV